MIQPLDLLGWPLRCILLPSASQIVCCFSKTGGEPDLSLHDVNHNIFRLNAQGEVVWQVQRDDSNHPQGWWDGLNQRAREKGFDGVREPFMYMTVKHADGYVDREPISGSPKDIQTWVPGSTIYLSGSAYQTYVLDPETGIAKNITEWPVRPW